MIYVVAENFQMYRYFLANFALENRTRYKFVDNDNWRGIDPKTIFILFDDYEKNDEWRRGQLPVFLSRCYNVYTLERVQYIDYRALVKDVTNGS